MSDTHTYKPMSMRRRSTIWGYIFLTPTIIGLLVFWLFPMFTSLALSFTKWNVISPPEFVALQNYKEMVKDPLVLKSLSVTLYYTLLAVPGINIVSLLLAGLLNAKIKGLSIYRTILYIPAIVPTVAGAALWLFIFNPASGIANTLLKAVGLPPSNWLFDPNTVIPSMAIMAVWGAGSTVVIYLAGLQGMPSELYEAATVDGAGVVRKYVNITFPLLSPVIFYNVIITIIGCVQTFSQGYIMTKGGPMNASLFFMLHLYNTAFKNERMGYACAMAWLLFGIIAFLTAINFAASKKWVYYETGKV